MLATFYLMHYGLSFFAQNWKNRIKKYIFLLKISLFPKKNIIFVPV